MPASMLECLTSFLLAIGRDVDEIGARLQSRFPQLRAHWEDLLGDARAHIYARIQRDDGPLIERLLRSPKVRWKYAQTTVRKAAITLSRKLYRRNGLLNRVHVDLELLPRESREPASQEAFRFVLADARGRLDESACRVLDAVAAGEDIATLRRELGNSARQTVDHLKSIRSAVEQVIGTALDKKDWNKFLRRIRRAGGIAARGLIEE